MSTQQPLLHETTPTEDRVRTSFRPLLNPCAIANTNDWTGQILQPAEYVIQSTRMLHQFLIAVASITVAYTTNDIAPQEISVDKSEVDVGKLASDIEALLIEGDKSKRVIERSNGPPGFSPNDILAPISPIILPSPIHRTLNKQKSNAPKRRLVYVIHRPIFIRRGHIVPDPNPPSTGTLLLQRFEDQQQRDAPPVEPVPMRKPRRRIIFHPYTPPNRKPLIQETPSDRIQEVQDEIFEESSHDPYQ
ncbi:unnamed protein product [Haemonchus placei]|uniref:Uncharacterized protein n=1 Tax=Haemonchus placei TaxID=6290 RepID=A0A0N4X1W6_HAEPC|nr:unnamed protein product [Haemonchus placei]